MKKKYKILIAPLNFGANISNTEATEIIAQAFADAAPEIETVCFPLLDGGHGSIQACKYHRRGLAKSYTVHDALNERITCDVFLCCPKATIIECAMLLDRMELENQPAAMYSYGIGELINEQYYENTEEIRLLLRDVKGIDFGCGAADALGAEFLDAAGKKIDVTATTITDAYYFDKTNIPKLRVICYCDRDVPLCGPNGIVNELHRRSGKNAQELSLLDRNLSKLVRLLPAFPASVPGDGCGGGLAYMMRAMYHAEFRNCREELLADCGFSEVLKGCRRVVTAEGILDRRSLDDDVISGIRKLCGSIPITAIIGNVKDDLTAEDFGIDCLLNADIQNLSRLKASSAKQLLYVAAGKYAERLRNSLKK